MKKIRKGDNVIVTSGRDKGRKGAVIRVVDDATVIVENVNRVKRHTRGNPQANKPGGIIELPYLDGVQWAQWPEVRR